MTLWWRYPWHYLWCYRWRYRLQVVQSVVGIIRGVIGSAIGCTIGDLIGGVIGGVIGCVIGCVFGSVIGAISVLYGLFWCRWLINVSMFASTACSPRSVFNAEPPTHISTRYRHHRHWHKLQWTMIQNDFPFRFYFSYNSMVQGRQSWGLGVVPPDFGLRGRGGRRGDCRGS